jgi:deoxycytidine triphosphate deaminase
MFIKPTYAIEQGWIRGITDPAKQVQPNAIDFTLDRLAMVQQNQGPLPFLTEDRKNMRTSVDVELSPQLTWTNKEDQSTWTTERLWHMHAGRVYDGMSDMYVELPDGVAAILYTRSTLARNGVFLMSGLYDSGYKGHIGFTIYPIAGPFTIGPGTRVGQIAFVRAESAGLYAGGWNHNEGTHYTETK